MSNQQPYPSYDGQDGRPDPHEGQQPPAAQEPAFTQTWEGQTWDTQFQPVQQPYRPQDAAAPGAADDTAYMPPVSGGYALPPEAPAPYAEYPAAPTAYEPQATTAYEPPSAASSAAAPGAFEPGHAPAPPRGAYDPASGAYQPQPAQSGYEPAPGAYQHSPAQGSPSSGAYEPAPQGYAPAAAAYEPAHGAAAAAPAPHPAATDSASYSAPTTMGNARPQAPGSARAGETPLTAAQRARAEGRSPIIAPGMQPAALTAVLALLLAGAAAVGQYALLVPLVLLQAVTAAGWFRLNGMWPARQGIALAFLGGVTADIALLAVDAEHAPAAIIGTLGVWVLLTLVLQLRNRAPADERMYGLTATVTSAALAVIAAGHLAAAPEAVTVAGVAVAVAVLARALPLSGVASVVVALLAAAGAGIAAGGVTDMGAEGALLGFAAGVFALIGLRVASYDYPSRFVHMTAGVALPLTVAAPAVYLIGRAIA